MSVVNWFKSMCTQKGQHEKLGLRSMIILNVLLVNFIVRRLTRVELVEVTYNFSRFVRLENNRPGIAVKAFDCRFLKRRYCCNKNI